MASVRGLLVLPMLLLSALRGIVVLPHAPPTSSVFKSAVRIVLISLVDGFASTGVIFAGLEGGRTWALWVCASAAALAGFYSMPIQYSQYFNRYPRLIKLYAGNGRVVVATLLTAAVGISIYYMRNDGDAFVYAIFALVPPLLLFVKHSANSPVRSRTIISEKGTAVYMRPLLQNSASGAHRKLDAGFF